MPPPIEVANLGMADSLILMVLALVVFGPRRLPQIGRQIGKLMYEFRKASNDFKFQMEEELRISEEADRRKREEAERQQRLALAAQSASTEPSSVSTEGSPAGQASRDQASQDQASQDQATQTEAAPTEAPYPRIQPPATGEPVAANRPGSVPAESLAESPAESAPESAAHAVSTEANSDKKEAAADHNGAVTEQAAHNG
jgi:sec-independent protein translocase protein TatB